jgi:hypothetical protein
VFRALPPPVRLTNPDGLTGVSQRYLFAPKRRKPLQDTPRSQNLKTTGCTTITFTALSLISLLSSITYDPN